MDKKTEYWHEVISDWQASGQTQKDYCAEHNLAYATFGYWRRKLGETHGEENAGLTCVQIAAAPLTTGLDCRIEAAGLTLTAGKATITINGCLSIGTLAQLASLCHDLNQRREAGDVPA